MQSIKIREKFFNYFQKQGHTIVASSSLIPAQDPTLLFTNAGMNQFKDVFLGLEKRSYSRAVSIQKCMRAGGKHSDLDNVGFTKRHLTFFEMMGNFSFGDYFKKEAIEFAWQFLTKEMNLDPNKLYASVFRNDDESYKIWNTVIGLPPEKIVRLGEADNFWSMGDVGPCGPCTEIYIDRGPSLGCGKKDCGPGCSCDRFLEVWNLVFMQYDRQPDGELKPLKQVGVDTGMGLERLTSIMQNVDSVFETDLFMPIIQRIEELTGISYKNQTGLKKASFHVLADHIRSCTFLIADGCAPSNEGRGYVLRKIIRRAALFQQKLTDKNIFPQLVPVVVSIMAPIYPNLKDQEKIVIKVLESEVEKFTANLIQGQHILRQFIEDQKKKKSTNITGAHAFLLYDTYGFPLELTQLITQEHGFTVDTQDFEKHMEKQREQSGKKVQEQVIGLPEHIKTEFLGYTDLEASGKITALIDQQNKSVNTIPTGQSCWIIPDRSPFYPERGGQVSDSGIVVINNILVPFQKLKWIGNAIAISIVTPSSLKIGDTIIQHVDKQARWATMKNHTATHLLQSALIQLLGKQIKQSGSLVAPDYFRFDFTYHENLTSEQIKQIEEIVNTKIQENIPVQTTITTYKDAVNRGVIAYFGDKYNPEAVRMVQVEQFSSELCGGTHVQRTGDIGIFKITEVSALSAGQRRITALTGLRALALFQKDFDIVKQLAQQFKVKPDDLLNAIAREKEQFRNIQNELNDLRKQLISSSIPQWLNQIEVINDIPFLYIHLEDFDASALKDIAQQLIQKKPGFYFILSNSDTGSNFYVHGADIFAQRINLQEFAQWLRENLSLKGGLKGTIIQGGGPRIDTSPEQTIKAWIKKNT